MRRRIGILLVMTNLVSLTALVGLAHYYRVPGKIYRRFVGESRIPFISEPFRINRYYDGQRDLFQIYNSDNVHSLVLGDSLVSLVSWAELLGNADVADRGIPGDTSAGLLNRIEDYSDLSLNVCVLFVGTNDVLLNRPEAESIESYKTLTKRCRTIWPTANIVCVSVPPFASWVESAEDRNARIQRFNDHAQHIASETENVKYIDLATIVTTQDGYLSDSMTTDGVHLSAKAYAALKDLLLPFVPTGNSVEVDSI